PEDPPRVRHGRRHRPSEHLRVPLWHTPCTELVKGGTTGIRHQDFGHARGDAVPYELVQGLDQVLPKTDIRPHEEIERRAILGREFRKGAVPGGEVPPVALRVQLEIRKYRRI